MNTLRVNFHHRYHEFTLDTAFEFPTNNIISVTGHSGAGKTSLLRCIAGLEKAQQGFCYFNQQRWQNSSNGYFLSTHLRPLAYTFQEPRLFPHLSVRKNLFYGYERTTLKKYSLQPDEIFVKFHVDHLLERDISKLSGGEQQRVAIVRSLLKSPELWLLDEPFSTLDDFNKNIIIDEIIKYQKQMNMTIIYISHYEDNLTTAAQHHLILKDGKICESR